MFQDPAVILGCRGALLAPAVHWSADHLDTVGESWDAERTRDDHMGIAALMITVGTIMDMWG